MTSSEKISINGVVSDTLDIWIDRLPLPPMAQARYTLYNAGDDEDVTTPDDAYNDVTYTINFYTFNRTNHYNSDIYAYFAGARILEISRLPGYYFKVRKVSGIEPKNTEGVRGDYSVTLTLAPFKYKTSNDEIAISSGDAIENTGNRYSCPTIRANLSGTANIYTNGSGFTITATGNNITIDSEKLLVYDSNGAIITNSTAGYFPMLAVGTNAMWFTGNISNVRLKKNERCY